MTFSTVVLVVVVLAVVAAISPPVQRLFKAVYSKFGAAADKAAESLHKQDPLSAYKSQIANAIDSGKNASKVVEQAAKQLESLQRQIADDEKDQVRLVNRIKAVIANGDPNGNKTKYALDLDRVEQNLNKNREQLAIAQETYDDNISLVEKYERDVAEARKDAEHLGFQLEQTKAEKDLYDMSSNLKNKLNLGDLAESRRRVQEQIDANRGSARASKDLGRLESSLDDDEDYERIARSEAILSRFESKTEDKPQS